jgi:hypothetical protein
VLTIGALLELVRPAHDADDDTRRTVNLDSAMFVEYGRARHETVCFLEFQRRRIP